MIFQNENDVRAFFNRIYGVSGVSVMPIHFVETIAPNNTTSALSQFLTGSFGANNDARIFFCGKMIVNAMIDDGTWFELYIKTNTLNDQSGGSLGTSNIGKTIRCANYRTNTLTAVGVYVPFPVDFHLEEEIVIKCIDVDTTAAPYTEIANITFLGWIVNVDAKV